MDRREKDQPKLLIKQKKRYGFKSEDREKEDAGRQEGGVKRVEGESVQNSGNRNIHADLPGRKKDRTPIWSIISFSISVLILFLTGLFIFFSTYPEKDSANFIPGHFSWSEPSAYVTSYLSHNARLHALRSVYFLLKKNRKGLRFVQMELNRIEKDREYFIDRMEQRKDLYRHNISIFGLNGSEKGLQSIVLLIRNKLDFNGEYRSRINRYEDIYETRKSSLIERKEVYERSLTDLTRFMNKMVTGKGGDLPLYRRSFYLDEMKIEHIERVIFFIENEEYGEALQALESVTALPFDDREVLVKTLLTKLLAIVKEYDESIDFFKDNSPLDDLKSAYLNEDYTGALALLDSLENNDFIKPILSVFREALYTNRDAEEKIENDIAMNREIIDLSRKAEKLEREGELEKALDIYEDLLIFRIPSYDREYVIGKIHSLWLPLELSRIKRQENTKAIKYLESARVLDGEGKEEEALDYYRLLITECPNSDFIDEAVSEIIKIARLERIPQ